jgi:hypothetical protein
MGMHPFQAWNWEVEAWYQLILLDNLAEGLLFNRPQVNGTPPKPPSFFDVFSLQALANKYEKYQEMARQFDAQAAALSAQARKMN